MNVNPPFMQYALHLENSLVGQTQNSRSEMRRQAPQKKRIDTPLKRTQLDESVTQFATAKLPQAIFSHFYTNQSGNFKEITPVVDVPKSDSFLNGTLAPIENIRRAFLLTITFAGLSTLYQLKWDPFSHLEQYNESFNWQKIATNIELPLLYDLCQKHLGVTQTAASTLIGVVMAAAYSIKMPDAATGLWFRGLRELWGNLLAPIVPKKENDSIQDVFTFRSIMNRISGAFKLSIFNSWWIHSGLSFGKYNDNLNAWAENKAFIGALTLAPALKELSNRIYKKIKGPEYQEDLITGKVDKNWKSFLALPNLQATLNHSKSKVAVLATFTQKGRKFSLPFTVTAKGNGKYSYEVLGTSKTIEEYLTNAVTKEFGHSSEPVTYRLRTFIPN